MPVRKSVVRSPIGLHARPAAEFVRAVKATGLPITIARTGEAGADARSLLEVMTADFQRDCEVELSVSGSPLPSGWSRADVERSLESLGVLLETTQAPRARR
ncbi:MULTISPECIES: HPr family phosphocarrier protein [Arthrobacter]|uniref:Phosphocarrier protein HPr n=1 Tax=Arthrobacter oryzae TaxID=409290 RepID=A0A3N0C6E1_9MICC|nr:MULTISPECIES: HPr family phosphocarrier protein [Arthrobacter]QYF90171.1 HPr family phosphocarrier protein [Arthrobacter sp. PAMC25284]RNL58361.1 HPr family phosphocarrier protein [Arthrobacter oryzae]